LRILPYTHATGTCNIVATSWTVRRWLSSLAASVREAMFGELSEDSSEDSKRGAGCLEDALFSREANWGEEDFMFATQSFSERLLEWTRYYHLLRAGVHLPNA